MSQRGDGGSGKGRASRLAQGTGDAAVNSQYKLLFDLNVYEDVDGGATDLLSIFADNLRVLSGERKGVLEDVLRVSEAQKG